MTDENQATAVEDEAESFGVWLRSQREVRQVELQTISHVSRINVRYLEALEQDRFELLPATIFVKGFLREYARVVGLDADEVVNFFLAASGNEVEDEQEANPDPKSSVGWTGPVVVVVLAILAFLVWWGFYADPDGETAADMEAMAPPLTAEVPPPPPPAALPEHALRVTLEFQATSWIDVHSDGERTVSELRVQGESLTVTADEEVRLRLRNADAAAIEVNGEPFEHAVGDGEEIVIAVPGADDEEIVIPASEADAAA